MIFPGAFLLALLALLITPTLSAPIFSTSTGSHGLDTHSLHASLQKRSPVHWSSQDRPSPILKRSFPESIQIIARDASSAFDARSLDFEELEARSFEDMVDPPMSKREPARIERRNIFSKMKAGFQKMGAAIKHGVQKAGNAIKHGFQKAAATVKKGVQRAAAIVKKGFQRAASAVKNTIHKVAWTVKKGVQRVATAFKKAGSAIKQGVRKVGSAIKKAVQKGKSLGEKIRDSFRNFGNRVKDVFHKAGQKIKQGFQHAGKKIKEGFQKAGKWIKDNGAKVAKFGLKVYATATKIASHVVGFIPGVGKIAGKALSGLSKLADFGSSKINADLGSLDKGMKIMDKIQNPLSGVAGKVLDAVLKRDMEEATLLERDFLGGEDLSERDLADLLDARSLDNHELFERDYAKLDARSLDEEIDARSLDDEFELQARAFDDGLALEERSWDFEDEA